MKLVTTKITKITKKIIMESKNCQKLYFHLWDVPYFNPDKLQKI